MAFVIISSFALQTAVANALRYFPSVLHEQLAPEFAQELEDFGHIYMYRYLPTFPIRYDLVLPK